MTPPNFSAPPKEYDQQYMNAILHTLRVFLVALTNPGDIRGTALVLTDVPSSGYGLEVGSVYAHGTALYIVREGDVFAATPALTVELGTVSAS
jgi:hypothetical protein